MTTSEKKQWISGVTQIANQLDAVVRAADRLKDQFWAKGFNSGGIDELTDDDINGSGNCDITIAEVTAFYTVLENLVNFYNNGAVTQADRKTPTLAVS
jgi:hypothetical protein